MASEVTPSADPASADPETGPSVAPIGDPSDPSTGDPVPSRWSPARARLVLLSAISCLGPLACFVPYASGMAMTLALLSVVAVVCIGWFAVLGPLVTDLFPAGNSASVWAIAGAFGAVGAMISNHAIGRISSLLGTERMFLALGCLHLLALGLLWFFVKTDRQAEVSGQPV